jgi:hypothetical protein
LVIQIMCASSFKNIFMAKCLIRIWQISLNVKSCLSLKTVHRHCYVTVWAPRLYSRCCQSIMLSTESFETEIKSAHVYESCFVKYSKKKRLKLEKWSQDETIAGREHRIPLIFYLYIQRGKSREFCDSPIDPN